MADDEQFSLCWNNFNSNLSAGFHESLCRGDLVDVTLAAEGQFVKAHRLVLSVCSPYFRKMFTQMPANQHAFVFLKDVSHSALKDLIQFMYCGEVNVKQDALPAFISTAEALQIKGLTDGEPAPSQSPAKPSTPAPQQSVPGPSMTTASPRVKQRSSTIRSYKIESEDSGDDKSTQQAVVHQTTTQQTTQQNIVQPTQKRPAQRSITPHTVPIVKRVKNSDPLEATDPTQITVQTVSESKTSSDEPEFIDLPIDLPTKSEPDYAEETGEVEAAEQEATYVEDDSYGDMKYDESYFTENDETGAAATTSATVKATSGTFSESYVSDAGEQTTTEAQAKGQLKDLRRLRRGKTTTIRSKRGRPRKKIMGKSFIEKSIDAIKGKSESIVFASSTIGGMKIVYKAENDIKVHRKRGRPKTRIFPKPLSERFSDALKEKGQPVEYLSSISGGMKIIYNGHHFKHIYKRGKFSVYQCSKKFDKNQCEAKVLVYEKYVYRFEKEHNHVDLAIDGTATEPIVEKIQQDPVEDVEILNFKVSTSNSKLDQLQSKTYTISEEIDEVQQSLPQQEDDDYMAPEDFKAKIKKRLQKVLLGKKCD